MFRSLLRMLKHITLAIIAIIAMVCIAEVGLRGRDLYERCSGSGGALCPLTPRPCAIAFQQLPPLTQVTRTASGTDEPFVVRTNSRGLRGPEIPVPKSADVFRIVCLGDDATFAAEMPEEQTFPALVAASLREQSSRPIEVVNAGIPGYCPLLSLAWARQRLPSLQPDLVILCCDHSDVTDDRRVRPYARYCDDGTLESICHPAVSQRPSGFLRALEGEFALAALANRYIGDCLDEEGDAGELPDGWDPPSATGVTSALSIRQTWEPIGPLRDLCRLLSADFVVALVPSRPTTSASADDTTRLLGEVTEQAGVPFLDVSTEFAPHASPSLFVHDSGALSAEGHLAFAELLGWAIVHRDGGAGDGSDSPSSITPAAASTPAAPRPVPAYSALPQVTGPQTAAPQAGAPDRDATQQPTTSTAGSTPLPSLGRRPRSSDKTPRGE